MSTIHGFETIGITVDQLIDDTLRNLGARSKAELNRLTTTVDDNDTSLVFDFDLAGIRPGVHVELGDELCYVWETNTSTKTAVVQRGIDPSTAAAHTSGALVTVNPRFPRAEILQALRTEIRSWPPALYGLLTITVDAPVSSLDVVLPELEFYRDLRLLRVQSERLDNGVTRYVTQPGHRIVPNLVDGIPDGYRLEWNHHLPEATTFRVFIGAGFTPDAMATTTDIGSIGLSASMADIAALGAAWRLLPGEEARRTDTAAQGGSRTSEEAPPGHALQLSNALLEQRNTRIGDEIARLANSYGWVEA